MEKDGVEKRSRKGGGRKGREGRELAKNFLPYPFPLFPLSTSMTSSGRPSHPQLSYNGGWREGKK
jgi:hypothetical protein